VLVGGLTPRHHESDTTMIRGHVTKQGSRLVRWAAVEAVQRLPHDWKLRGDRDRIAGRRGRASGKVAVARKLLTLVFLRAARRSHSLPGPGCGRDGMTRRLGRHRPARARGLS
jgi:transposase